MSRRDNLAPVPDPPTAPEPGTRTIELAEPYAGHFVTFREELTGEEYVAFLRGRPADVYEAGWGLIISHDFGDKPASQLPVSVISAFLTAWRDERDRGALDPTIASG